MVATVRGSGRTELHALEESCDGLLEIEHLDINEPAQLGALRSRLAARRFALLFVNVGVASVPHATTANVSTEEFTRLMVTNALSPMRVIESLGELVDPNGTIGIMSSGQGSIANNERGGFEIYRASKSALNQLMRSYAARHHSDHRTLLLMAPGWVKTELGGPDARLTVEESIPKLVAVIEAHRGAWRPSRSRLPGPDGQLGERPRRPEGTPTSALGQPRSPNASNFGPTTGTRSKQSC